MDERVKDARTVRCSVYADDKKLASTPLLRRDRRHRFHVNIPADCATLRLVTTDGGDGKDNDWCDWVNAAVEIGEDQTYEGPVARISLPAPWAWLKGDGISYDGSERILGWNENAQACWDFLCPADGKYELFISYGCNKEEAGSEFVVDIGGQSFPGKVESTGDWARFRSFSVGKVSLKKGEIYDVTVKLTKQVGGAMHLRCLTLVNEE